MQAQDAYCSNKACLVETASDNDGMIATYQLECLTQKRRYFHTSSNERVSGARSGPRRPPRRPPEPLLLPLSASLRNDRNDEPALPPALDDEPLLADEDGDGAKRGADEEWD